MNLKGMYYVLLPDGRLQKTVYTVNGDEGYVAHVTYEGEANNKKAQYLNSTYNVLDVKCIQHYKE